MLSYEMFITMLFIYYCLCHLYHLSVVFDGKRLGGFGVSSFLSLLFVFPNNPLFFGANKPLKLDELLSRWNKLVFCPSGLLAKILSLEFWEKLNKPDDFSSFLLG